MKNLPRILVIDDDYGRIFGERNRKRENFCYRLGLNDITGDSVPEGLPDAEADAIFCSGQVESYGQVENDLEGTLELIRNGWLEWPRWALLLLDLHFKTGPVDTKGNMKGRDEDRIPQNYFGLQVIEALHQDPHLSQIPTVILSSMNRKLAAGRFSDAGARNFREKEKMSREDFRSDLNDFGLIEDDAGIIIGHSLPLLMCLQKAREKASSGSDNILVLGETGTGKEPMSKYIHRQSPKRNGLFRQCFVHGTPETLVEQKVFGYMKGSFTDAKKDKAGDAELANHGTLFLDEFGDIPPSVQPKLLRLLDSNIRETQRLDAAEPMRLDIQIVMATNRFDAISAGGMRWDILQRIGVGKDAFIVLPPLRERKEDIPLLAEFLLRKHERKLKAVPRKISDDAMQDLLDYSWPGNVRELEGIIATAVGTYKGIEVLSKTHLSLGIGSALQRATTRAVEFPSGVPCMVAHQETKHLPVQIVKEHAANDILSLIGYLESFNFDALKPDQIYGHFPAIQKAYGELVARYLKAALVATKKLTPSNPSGETFYTTAIKFMNKMRKLSGSKAGDLVIKYLKISPESTSALLSDSMLKDVHEQVMATRRKGDKQKKREEDTEAN